MPGLLVSFVVGTKRNQFLLDLARLVNELLQYGNVRIVHENIQVDRL